MHNLFWALLVLFLFGALLRMDWVYYLVYVVGGVWVLSHWWVRRSLGKLTVHRNMLNRAFVGERIAVQLAFENLSWLPLPWLRVQERVPLDLKEMPNYHAVLSIAGHSKSDFDYRFHCKRRGYFPVGPLSLSTGDLFGFATAEWSEQEPIYVTVYPQVVSLQKLGLSSRSPFGDLSSNQRLFQDPARISGVRNYVSGDSMRQIHWKASARENTLLVKKFQPAIALEVMLVLDLDRHAYPETGSIGYSEWAITVAASIATYISDQRQPVGLICNGIDQMSGHPAAPAPARNGQGHLMGILGLLARIQAHEPEQPLEEWLPAQIADLAWGTTLIVITPNLSEAGLWMLHSAYRRGSNVLALICAPQPDYTVRQAQGKRLGVKVHRTIWEIDLHELSD